EDLLEALNVIFLIDAEGRLTGTVPLARLFRVDNATPLRQLSPGNLIQTHVDENEDRVTEAFDKYNIFTMPVVDHLGRLAGVITADDIISVLRQK
ncbi:MAG: CBS domain-containing protein, partial [Bryobacteraceae bacterium]